MLPQFECLTNEQAAAILGLKSSAASKRYQQALELLQSFLKGFHEPQA